MELEVGLRWPARCGEGPVWDATAGAVHWVDITAGHVHTTAWPPGPAATTRTLSFDGLVGAAAPRTTGGFVLAAEQAFIGCSAAGVRDAERVVLPPDERMNDAKCDPAGRLWAGSTERGFEPGRGRLWRLDHDGRAEPVLAGLTLPNGLDWSPDGRTFYLVDSMERLVLAFDHDQETGTLSARRVLFRTPEGPAAGLPDGMCVDTEGGLWLALDGGGRIERCSPPVSCGGRSDCRRPSRPVAPSSARDGPTRPG